MSPGVFRAALAPLPATLSVAAILLALFLVRLVIEGFYALPAPGGDSILFLDPAHSFCRTGFLGTALVPIDLAGQNRLVWHGFVGPWLLAELNPGCAIGGFFWVQLAIKSVSVALTYLLARAHGSAIWQALAISTLVLAIQSKLGFRPDVLAITWVLGIELGIARQRWKLAAALYAILLWTQPTIFVLYGAFLFLVRYERLFGAVRWGEVAAFAAAWAVCALLYPFPLHDLLTGLARHAALIGARHDGGLATYYLFTHFLPLWSLLFVAAFLILARSRPVILLMLPLIWWFGPRVPPTLYNVLALLPVVVILAIPTIGRRSATCLAAGSLAIGAAGLAQLSLRDLLSISAPGIGYEQPRRALLVDAANPAVRIEEVPGFARLWLREAGLPAPSATLPANPPSAKGPMRIRYIELSGRPTSPCPDQQEDASALRLGGRKLFNTPSGWLYYRCAQ